MDGGPILTQLLLSIGGSRIEGESGWGNFKDQRVVDFLMEYGRRFSTDGLECLNKTPFRDYQVPLEPGQCHKNYLNLGGYVGDGRALYRIAHGWALCDEGIWNCHSWCIPAIGPETVIETTTPRIAYFGFVIPTGINANPIRFVFEGFGLGDELEKWKALRRNES